MKGKYVYSAWSRLTAKTTAKKTGSPSNGNTNNGNTNNNGNADPLGFLNETYASLRKKQEKPLKFMLPTKFRASIFQSQML
ncbi:MAG: hypothetical protein ACLR2E_14900 [Lachnospiraceae bacterium]